MTSTITDDPAEGVIPGARASDPHTSRAAAAAVIVSAKNQRGRLLRAYGWHPLGLTDDEAQRLAEDVDELSCYWKRCSELRAAGLIATTGEVRRGRAGVDRLVCAITAAGAARLRTMGG